MIKATNSLGKKPTGERLERILASPNYNNGQFQNLSPTPQLANDQTMLGIMYERLFKKYPRLTPIDRIPSIKSDLLRIDRLSNVLVWFGHSSYYLQVDGLRFLIDPVFSGNASPIPNTINSFKGTDIYTVADFPLIDYLLITHDHYDHLDYKTIVALNDKVKKVICGLGVGEHFEYWGYDTTKIIEKDWHDTVAIKEDFTIFVQPARHFSGRSFKRNNTLWVSYILKSPTLNLFLGGDSGYGSHYADIANNHGPFDLAVLENGQYNKNWPYIHEAPEETLKAAHDLKAKRILPVHSCKFTLSTHPWDEPLIRITELNKAYGFPLVTPLIGEMVNLDDPTQQFEQWWKNVK